MIDTLAMTTKGKKMQLDKKYFESRRSQLDSAYNNIKPDWQELADYFLPRAVRFFITDVNKKPAKNNKIKDSATLKAVRNFASGMMSGATNPATNWFRLRIKNFDIKDDFQVKQWCGKTENIIRDIFNASNFYSVLTPLYKQFGVFGIGALALEVDEQNVLNAKLLPLGSYRIAKDFRGEVDTVCRHYTETAKNLYTRFGKDNVSDRVKTAVDNGRYEETFEIVHFVCPNDDYIPDSPWAENKKFLSVYYEISGDNDKFLSKSGFDKFPYVVFLSETNGEDVYPSDCPGFNALPDAKQLMAEVVDKGKAIKKVISPQLKGPAELKNKKLNDNPATFVETNQNGEGLTPIYQVSPAAVQPVINDIVDLRNSISEAFFNDLFAMILNTAERSRTATEVNELKEEKMVLLSPLLEQIHTGLKTVMEWVFAECFDKKILPEPPAQLIGGEIEIEFVSMLAQAQKGQKIAAIERFTTFTCNLANATQDPMLSKKLNTTKIVNDYADFVNINPEQIVSDKEIDELRMIQQQKEQQAQMMQQLQQGSEMYRNIGGSDVAGGALMERLGLQ